MKKVRVIHSIITFGEPLYVRQCSRYWGLNLIKKNRILDLLELLFLVEEALFPASFGLWMLKGIGRRQNWEGIGATAKYFQCQ